MAMKTEKIVVLSFFVVVRASSPKMAAPAPAPTPTVQRHALAQLQCLSSPLLVTCIYKDRPLYTLTKGNVAYRFS